MAELVDLSYTKAEQKEEQAESVSGEPMPYPWGMCISLESTELDKLGITSLPGVGDEVHFTAVAKVTNIAQSAQVGQDDSTRVGLQITMMQIDMIEPASEDEGESETPASEKAEMARKGGALGM